MSGTPPRLIVCGLGPGDPQYRSAQTDELLTSGLPVFLRTARHPGLGSMVDYRSFDHLYENAETFDEVYRLIAEALLDETSREGQVIYAVPGSPLVLERSVRRLQEEAELRSDELILDLLPAMSFLDVVWSRLRVDPIEDGVRLIDGHRFATQAAGQRGPLLVAHTHAQWVLSDMKLSVDRSPSEPVVVLQRLGTGEESVVEVPWEELDRIDADHLTTVFIPELSQPVGAELALSIEMMDRLREQCPWDRDQDHGTLRKYLREETYEVLDALDAVVDADPDDVGRPYEELESELGDLWFQILFHSRLAAEQGQFTVADVARTLTEKMVERHPHVFDPAVSFDGDLLPPQPSGRDDDDTGDSSEMAKTWEAKKAEQSDRLSVFDGIPSDLPSLAFADKALGKAIRSFGRPHPGEAAAVVDSVLAATSDQGDGPAAMGKVLLALALRGRELGLDLEHELRRAVLQLLDEMRALETTAASAGDESRSESWVVG